MSFCLVGGFALWAFLMYSAYQGNMVRLPVVGALAAKQAGLLCLSASNTGVLTASTVIFQENSL